MIFDNDRYDHVVNRPQFNSEIFAPGRFITVKWNGSGKKRNGIILKCMPHQINFQAYDDGEMQTYAITLNEYMQGDVIAEVVRGRI